MKKGGKKGPGPADYQTQTIQRHDRPLTGHKSYNAASQLFGKAKKDTMRVEIYDQSYERSYKNQLGPGPAAYSEMYRANSQDRFKQPAFPKQARKLTQAMKGPGPDHYEPTEAKDKQSMII